MGPVTAVARLERLDYFAGIFSSFPRRYTVGAKIRMARDWTGHVNYVHQPQDVTGYPGHTSVDIALTYSIRPGSLLAAR